MIASSPRILQETLICGPNLIPVHCTTPFCSDPGRDKGQRPNCVLNCVPKGLVFLTSHLSSSEFLGSIVVSIPACHAGDRGSIPRRGEFLFAKIPVLSHYLLLDFSSTFSTKLVANLAKFVLMDWEHFVIFRNFVS